ncbi:MAG TPA: polysaccharide deacetylase family protein, partial [Thermoanaerobaculia bacterium]|nr:polysaccharide deacetylase family protein [Thermoanaerobaculia bacterium]
ASPTELVQRLKLVPNPPRLAALEELRTTAPEPAPRRRLVSAGELPGLEAQGMAIGNHTLSHPCLPCCSAEEIRRELAESHDILAAALGHPPRAFAYPNGDQDPRVVAAVARTGYPAAFLFDHRLCRWPPRDPLRISRLRTNPAASPHRFRAILSGLHPFLHHAVGRD